MNISTKKGDNGETNLLGGKRVPKDHPLICILGELDELNSSIGVAKNFVTCSKVRRVITAAQSDLFEIGSILANPENKTIFDEGRTTNLESFIILFEGRVSELKNFILPGGCKSSSFLFQSRSVCRRVERSFVSAKIENQEILKYLNRLSDLLFMCARKENNKQGVEEIVWNE